MGHLKPIDLKEVAKIFTERYYPQWLSRVDRIWEMLEKVDPNSLYSESAKPLNLQGNTFGITGEIEPKFQECISGIAVFAFTCNGLKSDDEIAEPELQSRITTTSLNLKIPPGLQSKLEAVLSEMLPTIVGETIRTEEEKLEINFIENKIKVGGKVDSRNKQQFKLLECFILEDKEIHWVESIRLFDEWRRIRVDIPNLKKNFGVTISKLRGSKSGFFTENKLNLEINSLSNGFSKLIGIENYNSNILQAKSLYKEAFFAYRSGEFDKAQEKLVTAIDTYPEHIPSLELLVRLLLNVEIDSSFVFKAKRVLQREISILEKAIGTTCFYMKRLKNEEWCNAWNDGKAKHDFESEIEIFNFKLNSELESLSEGFDNLKKWLDGKNISFESDNKYEEIKGLIKEQNFNELVKKNAIKRVLAIISGQLAFFAPQSEANAKEILMELLFHPEQSKRLDFSKALTLKELQNYLILRAKYLINDNYRGSELPSRDKKSLREFNKIEKELQKTLCREPTQEECFEALKKEKKVGEEYCEYIKDLINKSRMKSSYDDTKNYDEYYLDKEDSDILI